MNEQYVPPVLSEKSQSYMDSHQTRGQVSLTVTNEKTKVFNNLTLYLLIMFIVDLYTFP